MHRLRHLSRSGWITVGLVIGAVLIPATAFAAATVVSITGAGNTASVSKAGQLRAIEMDPVNIVHGSAHVSGGACAPLAVAPANRALIIKQINISAEVVTSASAATIYSSEACTGQVAAAAALPARGVTSLPLGPGIPVPAGTGLYITPSNAVVRADAMGYSLTPSALPASIAARQHIGSAPKALARTRTH